jgi:hypothetical protein
MNSPVRASSASGEAARRFIRATRLSDVRRAALDDAQLHPAAADPAAAAAAVATSRATPLSAIFGVLRDGEVVILVLKPSLWFIAFQCVRFAAAVILALLCVRVFGEPRLAIHRLVYIDIGAFLIAARLMYSVLQWMGRYYVLTNRRILRLSGILSYDVYDCPLRKVAHTELTTSVKERLCHLGSIEIHPCDPGDDGRTNGASAPVSTVGMWQTIAQPGEVHEQVVAAIRRAKNGGV